MKIGSIDLDREVMIVAEVGNNHEGSLQMARELVERAAEAGAHAVKFQTFVPELFTTPREEQRLQRLTKFCLPQSAWPELAALAASRGLIFFSTPLDLVSAALLAPIVPVFKIASSDNTFTPLLENVAASGKPIIISSGLASVSELQASKSAVEAIWNGDGVSPGLAVLHCVCSYPVPLEQANLSAIRTLAATLNTTVGYSDHTLGIEAPVLSVGFGARIIEKHFTLDKNYSDFRDHQLSADPAEFKEMVRRVKQVQDMAGDGIKILQACEQSMVALVRRSVAVNKSMSRGATLTWNDLSWVRPGDGFPVGEERRVLGRKLAVDLTLGDIIRPEHLQP